MPYRPFKRRLEKLEHGSRSTTSAVLTFADGSTRASPPIQHPLDFCLAAFARLAADVHESARVEGEAEPSLALVRPVSKYDGLIDLFGAAVSIQSDDRFLYTIQDVCRQIREEEPKTIN